MAHRIRDHRLGIRITGPGIGIGELGLGIDSKSHGSGSNVWDHRSKY